MSVPTDPWITLFIPALLGHPDQVAAAYDALVQTSTPRGDLEAVAARATLALGDSARSAHHLALALDYGGPEAAAVATLTEPDGASWVAQRVARAPGTGPAADAMCDLAILALGSRRLEAAQAAIRKARAHCPAHLEARRWAEFLVRGEGILSWHDEAPSSWVVDQEWTALWPDPRTGLLSPERFRRRVNLQLRRQDVRPGSALAHLVDVGATTRWLGTDEEYDALAPEDPLVDLEIEASVLELRLQQRRCIAQPVAQLDRRVPSSRRSRLHQAVMATREAMNGGGQALSSG